MLAAHMPKEQSLSMERTHRGHLQGQVSVQDELCTAIPYQPSVDGNTVDSQLSKAFLHAMP